MKLFKPAKKPLYPVMDYVFRSPKTIKKDGRVLLQAMKEYKIIGYGWGLLTDSEPRKYFWELANVKDPSEKTIVRWKEDINKLYDANMIEIINKKIIESKKHYY